jgi:hypothetical protein
LIRAGKICIAEVEELVEPGEIKPEDVHLPGIFVNRIFKSEKVSHTIKMLRLQNPEAEKVEHLEGMYIHVTSRILFCKPRSLDQIDMYLLDSYIHSLFARIVCCYCHQAIPLLFLRERTRK